MEMSPEVDRAEYAYTTAQSAARNERERIVAELKQLEAKAAALEQRLNVLIRLETLLDELRAGTEPGAADAVLRPLYAPSSTALPHRESSGLAHAAHATV